MDHLAQTKWSRARAEPLSKIRDLDLTQPADDSDEIQDLASVLCRACEAGDTVTADWFHQQWGECLLQLVPERKGDSVGCMLLRHACRSSNIETV